MNEEANSQRLSSPETEKFSSIPLIRVEATEKSDTKLQRQTKVLNLQLETVWIIGAWAKQLKNNTPKKVVDNLAHYTSEATLINSALSRAQGKITYIEAISSPKTWGYNTRSPISLQHVTEFFVKKYGTGFQQHSLLFQKVVNQEIQEHQQKNHDLKEKVLGNVQPEKIEAIPTSSGGINRLITEIPGLLHDEIGQSLAITKMRMEIMALNIKRNDKHPSQDIVELLRILDIVGTNVKSFYETITDIASGEYHKEILSAEELIQETIKYSHAFVGDTKLNLYNLRCEYSTRLLQRLIINIVTNSRKAQDNSLDVRFFLKPNLVTTNNEEFFELMIDDDGPGLPESILKNGWGKEKSRWGGSGIGMANHARIIKEQFGGQLIPARVVDNEGYVYRGARVILQLPIIKGNP